MINIICNTMVNDNSDIYIYIYIYIVSCLFAVCLYMCGSIIGGLIIWCYLFVKVASCMYLLISLIQTQTSVCGGECYRGNLIICREDCVQVLQ